MDAGLQIKELAGLLGVTEDTVINWEVRGISPLPANLGNIVRLLAQSFLLPSDDH
jgi:DNA-binding transcriptional regulator YiaG